MRVLLFIVLVLVVIVTYVVADAADQASPILQTIQVSEDALPRLALPPAYRHLTTTDNYLSRLGPEERRTLLDDDIFEEDSKSRNGVNSRKRDCAQDFEDCRHKNCCNQCTRCACKRGGRDCRCNERNELALFLGLCRK